MQPHGDVVRMRALLPTQASLMHVFDSSDLKQKRIDIYACVTTALAHVPFRLLCRTIQKGETGRCLLVEQGMSQAGGTGVGSADPYHLPKLT